MEPIHTTQTSYDAIAEDYADHIYDELQYKPLDCELLDRFARRTMRKGPLCDLGCGPGQVARYLHDCGADVIGIDLSPGMIEVAQHLNPGIIFQQGDMRALSFDDNALAGIAAFYSILHVPREHVVTVLRGLLRVLQPNGLLLLGFHRGDNILHFDSWWDKAVALDFTFFLPDEMHDYLVEAGFHVDQVIERDAYPDVEYPTQRVYILASKPAE